MTVPINPDPSPLLPCRSARPIQWPGSHCSPHLPCNGRPICRLWGNQEGVTRAYGLALWSGCRGEGQGDGKGGVNAILHRGSERLYEGFGAICNAKGLQREFSVLNGAKEVVYRPRSPIKCTWEPVERIRCSSGVLNRRWSCCMEFRIMAVGHWETVGGYERLPNHYLLHRRCLAERGERQEYIGAFWGH